MRRREQRFVLASVLFAIGCSHATPRSSILTSHGAGSRYDDGFVASCPGGIPRELPPALDIELARDGARWRLHSQNDVCRTDLVDLLQPFGWEYPPPTCIAITDGELAATYAALREQHVDAIRVRRPELPPRGVSLELRWGTGFCRVGAITHAAQIHREDRDRFRRALDVLRSRTGSTDAT